jgi:hypothetical protein
MSLEVENVLRIQTAFLEMGEDGVLLVEGPNEAGKSSAIKCVEMMFGGGKVIPPEPLHGDAKKGHIIARVGAFTVTRTFRHGKSPQFFITMGKGKKLARPQEVMAGMCKARTLDPVAFLAMKPEEQSAILAEFAKFDAAEFDAEEAQLCEDRKYAKKEAARLTSAMNEAPRHTNAPETVIDVKELMEELKRRQRVNAIIEERCRGVAAVEDRVARAEEHCESLQSQIVKLTAELENGQKALAIARQDLDVATKESHEQEPENEQEITDKINAADELNRMRRDNDRHAELRAEADAAGRKADKLEEDVKAIRAAKAKARLEASKKIPVPDLDLTDDGLFYKGKPFCQAGRSAQLRVSTSVAIALNKDSTVKLLLIDDGEKLDANGKRIVLEMAKQADFQVMMTRVISEHGASEGAVVIEDGRVGE